MTHRGPFQPQTSCDSVILYVLVLAGIELIFFIVAGKWLCFGFALKTVLMIVQGCFCYC